MAPAIRLTEQRRLNASERSNAPGPRVQFWATNSGGETLDGPNGSGNPFAAALVEAMADPTLDFVGACAALRHRTSVLSGGRMTAETIGVEAAPVWRFAPAGSDRRVALIVIFSDYSASDAAPSLPGAEADGARVNHAFAKARFVTKLVANPSPQILTRQLADFARRSAHADVAAIYSTGHGVEFDGIQYVLYGDHAIADGTAGLERAAAHWTDIAAAAQAPELNLTFWAGCRDHPFA